MEPVLRITGHSALTLTLHGLTVEQASFVQGTWKKTSGSGTELPSVPPSFSHAASVAAPQLVLSGSVGRLKRFARLLSANYAPKDPLPRKIQSLLDNVLRTDYKIECRGKVLELGRTTRIMGILNATPDSFSDGGLYADPKRALAHAREMAAAGADIIDIGGESTRPGAEPLSLEEELARIVPLIERLSGELAVPISVDTYKARVAEKAVQAGASIINDISGLRFSPDMAKVAADTGAALVIMHIKGTPRNMQQNPVYTDVINEIVAYLEEGIEIAEKAGVDREKLLVDPGIGFGKTLEHNLTILNRLEEFAVLGRPIVLGTSRKKFIGTVLGIPTADQRIDGTAATVALGIERGASVVRVHDVARMAQVARMTDAIVNLK